jgi:hypothetical protein
MPSNSSIWITILSIFFLFIFSFCFLRSDHQMHDLIHKKNTAINLQQHCVVYFCLQLKPTNNKFLGCHYKRNCSIPNENTDLQSNICPNQLQLTILLLLGKFNSGRIYIPNKFICTSLNHFLWLLSGIVHCTRLLHCIKYIYDLNLDLLFETFLDMVCKRDVSEFHLIRHSIIIPLPLWLYSPVLDLGHFYSFLIFFTVGRSLWTGDQPVARSLPAHRIAQNME